MSWSFSITPTARDQFAAAVDAAVATGQPAETPGLADDVAKAKEAVKSLASRLTDRAKIGGSCSGHCPVSAQDGSHSLNASCYAAD